MSRLSFEYGYSGKRKLKEIIEVVPAIAIQGKLYRNAGQAATTIAWIITNNIAGGDYMQFDMDKEELGKWEAKRNKLYKRARRRVLPICERILK